MWNFFLGLAIFLFAAALIWIRWQERRYLKKPTREVLGKDLKKEIKEEQEVFLMHKVKFTKAMQQAKERIEARK